jgi:hypothetical protein
MMADGGARIVYRASDLTAVLDGAPALAALARDDPRVDPAYLFLRARAKRGRAVVVVVHTDGRPVGCLSAIEDCIRGTRSGMLSIGDRTGAGLVLAEPQHARDVFYRGLRGLLQMHRVHTVQINAVRSTFGSEGLADAMAGLPSHHQVTTRLTHYTLPNRLELTDSWEEFLKTLGPDTRRNLRRYPRRAERLGIAFESHIEPTTFRGAFDCLRRHADRWDGLDPREARVDPRNEIRVGLRSDEDGWLSVLAGWRHGERAYIATQMNHAALPQLSLSMVLRASLIQHLIEGGVREVVFLDGCAGALQLSCVEEPIERARIEVHTPLADLSRQALTVFWPRLANRIFRDDPAPLLWRPRPQHNNNSNNNNNSNG